jgi:hypothetical protein
MLSFLMYSILMCVLIYVSFKTGRALGFDAGWQKGWKSAMDKFGPLA